MKRIFAFAIGIVVALAVIVAHARGWLAWAEAPFRDWARRGDVPPRGVGDFWQNIFITLVSLAVAWVTLITAVRHRVIWLLLGLIAELLALAWIASLYHIYFPPLPCIVAAAFAYAAGIGYLAWSARPLRPKPEPKPEPAIAPQPKPVLKHAISKPLFPKAVLPPAPIARPPEKPRVEETVAGAPEFFETTVLVCDLAEKYDVIDNSDAPAAARAIDKFGQRASELLLKAGAHLYKADGEGLVALFGFPRPMPEHAENAVRAAFDLVCALGDESHASNGDNAAPGGAHIGISSGAIIAGRTEGRRELLVIGEAVELARRFCVANRFYGSRVLIGPRTFEMASSAVVARPIDFLSGVTAQERHEIYEPLALAADAPPELLARRDSFWKGVVLYREKRWVEALGEFQKARVAPDAEDPPLNLYLRRLEPLALQFMDTGRE